MRPQDFLTPAEFDHLLASTGNARERAILHTLAGTGLRVHELVALRVDNLDSDNGYIHVEVTKGSHPRTVICPVVAFEAIRAYLTPGQAGYVFPGRQDGHLSTKQVRRMLDEIAIRAGLQDLHDGQRRRITPHLLRHSHASWLLDRGISVADVQAQLGHASLATTGIYVARMPSHRRESFKRAGLI